MSDEEPKTEQAVDTQSQASDQVQGDLGDPSPKPKGPRKSPKRPGLDKGQPYGTVHGASGPVRYFQDGKYYDVDGKACKAP